MVKKNSPIIISLLLVAVLVVSGCVQRDYYRVGVEEYEELYYRAYDCEYDKITFEYTMKILDESLNLTELIQDSRLNTTDTIEMIIEMNDKHIELNEEFNFFEEPMGRIFSDYYDK